MDYLNVDMVTMNNKKSPTIKDYYRDKIVFVTGGTGFIGKCLVEKLLRTGEVREVIILVRPKRNLSPQSRITSCFTGPLYETLYEKCPNYLSKIKIVEGDIELKGLGLSEEDKNYIVEHTQILFNNAATVRFNEPIRKALQINVIGTKSALDIALEMQKLESFVHVSTAYSNSHSRYIREKVYSQVSNPDEIFSHMDDTNFDDIMDPIIKPWPNTYTFTKALAETLIEEYNDRLPVSIVRPSIVMASYTDPFPGWVDNAVGGNGIVIGWMPGIIRAAQINLKNVLDIIPVDIVTNTMIAAGWKTNKDRNMNQYGQQNPCKVYNCVSSTDNPITFGESRKIMKPYLCKYPVLDGFWLPMDIVVTTTWIYRILRLLMHTLPAYTLDFIVRLMGRKPTLVKLYDKIHKFQDSLTVFLMNEFNFETKNMRSVVNDMTPEDHHDFPLDVKVVNWNVFFYTTVMGTRKYFFKESLDNLSQAKKKYNIQLFIHYSLIFVFGAVLLHFMFRSYFSY